MSTFTPGPWQVIGGYNIYSQLGGISGDGSTADSSDGWHIASAGEAPTFSSGYELYLGRAVVRANVALIAAAPDLLEALEDLVRINEQHNAAIQSVTGKPARWKDDYLNQARAAIAKARGEA